MSDSAKVQSDDDDSTEIEKPDVIPEETQIQEPSTQFVGQEYFLLNFSSFLLSIFSLSFSFFI